MDADKLDQLLAVTSSAERILILPHNDPDPDAIASAVALQHLLVYKLNIEVNIAYRGIIGRAENKVLVRYLDNPLQRLTKAVLGKSQAIAIVDTQPGSGNSPIKPSSDIIAVIDHHPWHPQTALAPFVEVIPDVGATSTILTQHLLMSSIPIPDTLATALFYGIKTDTLGLSRSASPADIDAYSYLVPRIDSKALFEIERAQVPADYFRSLVNTLGSTRVYRDVLIATIGQMKYPDLAAEIADWLLRLKGIQWVICLGVYKDHLNLAVRSRHPRGGAGNLAQSVIDGLGTAGGHGSMAGGQIFLDNRDPEPLVQKIVVTTLAYFNIDPEETCRSLL